MMMMMMHRRKNNEEHVDIWKYNLYFYSSTVTFVWSRNTVRESSHISFFSGKDPLCELKRRPENTHGGVDSFAEVTSGSLSQSKIPDLVLSFNSHAEIRTRLFAHVFSIYGWLSELTHSRFFTVICWPYLRTEISFTVSTGNKLYPCHYSLFYSFLWNHFVGVILRPHWICQVHSPRRQLSQYITLANNLHWTLANEFELKHLSIWNVSRVYFWKSFL